MIFVLKIEPEIENEKIEKILKKVLQFWKVSDIILEQLANSV